MATLVQIENTPASKKLIDFLKTMSFVKIVEKEYQVRKEESIKALHGTKTKKLFTKTDLVLAAEELYNDYVNDKELTAFMSLDMENFYETR